MKFLNKCCINCKYHIKKRYGHYFILFCNLLQIDVQNTYCCKSYKEE